MMHVHPIVQQPHGSLGFNVFGATILPNSGRFWAPGYFQRLETHCFDGDILVVQRAGRQGVPGTGCKDVYMMHKDVEGQISLTRLMTLPHDRDLARDLARRLRALLDLAPPSEEASVEDAVVAGRRPAPAADEIPSSNEEQRAQAAVARARARDRIREQERAAAAEREAALAAETETNPGNPVDAAPGQRLRRVRG